MRDNAALYAGPGRVRVFEYWLDAILFKILAPPMVETIRRDLAFYAANGAHTVGALATGSMPFAAPNLNAYAFARLAWNPGLGAKAVREAFCTHVFRSGLHMPAYFEALERAFPRSTSTFVPRRPASRAEASWRPMADPPADIGSPFNVAAGWVGEAQARQERALDALDEAERLFQTMMRPPSTTLAGHPPRGMPSLSLPCPPDAAGGPARCPGGRGRRGGARRAGGRATGPLPPHPHKETEMRGFVREPYVAANTRLLWLFLGLALDRAEDSLMQGDGARRRRLRNRLETARQNFARIAALWPPEALPAGPAAT